MRQQLGQYNQRIEGHGNRFVAALITELEGGMLALVYIDDKVTLEIVPASEYRYIVLNPSADIERAKASMRSAAIRLGFDPGVQVYTGEIDSGQTHDDAAGGGASASEPGDAEELAVPGPGSGVHPGGQGDPLPGAGRGSLREGQPQSFDDLIGESTEEGSPDGEQDIFS